VSAESEEQVAQAITFLRERMPENFILTAMVNGEVVTMGGFSLNSARTMLKSTIETVSEQFAYKSAQEFIG
jgi:hypothetical protein